MPRFFARSIACAAIGSTVAAVAACSPSSSSHDATSACSVQFSGNVTDATTSSTGCAALTLSPDAGGGYVLSLLASSKQVAALTVTIGLGPSPSPGTVSSETVGDWSAVGASRGSSNCAFSAGGGGVPAGSFALTVSSVDANGGRGGAVHGTLDLTMYLHAPPAADCGLGDTENVEIVF